MESNSRELEKIFSATEHAATCVPVCHISPEVWIYSLLTEVQINF